MELFQSVVYLFLIGVAAHFIGQALPRNWFDPEGISFRMHPWEENGDFYRKIHIRKWKDKLPDASRVMPDMYRKEISGPPSEESLRRLIEESCVAEFIHKLLILLSLGVVKIWAGKNGWFCWLLCVLGNLPFILIQRFNRPRLQAALSRMQSKGTNKTTPKGI